jgi:hypothetical protein
MTKLLEKAIATVRQLSEEEQDTAARLLLAFANPDAARFELTDDQLAEVEQAKREVRMGRLATPSDMEAVWRRFNR